MVILITGVSSGFGRAFAVKLAGEGHKVYGTVRREVEKIAGVTYLNADMQDEESIKQAFDSLMRQEGHIDVFISNAGMGIGGPIEFCKTEDIALQMDINFMGMARWLSCVVPVMRQQKSGKIICMSSIGGLMGLPYQGAYSASKFAIEGYCQALRLELQKSGVSVTVIEPGDFSTNFTAKRKNVCPEDVYAAYPSYKGTLEGIEKEENSGLKPEYLAEQVSRIINKRNPAYSYIVATFIQKLSVFAKWLLPAPLFARILSIYYRL